MRAANSSLRSPAKTRWVWLSTKPGRTHRPAASMRRSAAAPAASTATMRSPCITTHAFVRMPSGPSPSSGSLVTSRPMSSTTSVGEVTTCAPRPTPTPSAPARRATSSRAWRPPATTTSPPTTTWCTSAAAPANTTASSTWAGSVPASRTDPRSTVTRSAAAPTRQGPDLRPADAGVAVGGGRPEQVGGPVVAPHAGVQPLVQLDAAGLLEQVDHRVRVAAERQPGSGVDEPPGRADAVGQVALGRGAAAHRAAVAAEVVDVGVGEVGGVDRREPLAQRRPRGPGAPSGSGRGPRGSRGSRPAARTRGRGAVHRARRPRPPRPPSRPGRRPAPSGSRRRSAGADRRAASSAAARSAQAAAVPSLNRCCTPSGSAPNPPWR